MSKNTLREASVEQVAEFIESVESINVYTALHNLVEVTWNQIMACYHCESRSLYPIRGGDSQSIPLVCHNNSSQVFQEYSSRQGIAPMYQIHDAQMSTLTAVSPTLPDQLIIPWEIAIRGCSNFKLRAGHPIISTAQASRLIPTDSLLRKQNPASIYADFNSEESIKLPSFDTEQFLSARGSFIDAEEAKAKSK